MKESEFKALDLVADLVNEECDRLLATPEMGKVKEILRQLSRSLPDTYSVELAVQIRVFDSDRDKAMRLLTAGLCANAGEEPYRAAGDSTSQRYIVDGEICEVPDDYCPHCWGAWDFKLLIPANLTCPECGYTIGQEIKLLLDTDVCPNCGKGNVTAANPVCNECGHTVNLDYVTWG